MNKRRKKILAKSANELKWLLKPGTSSIHQRWKKERNKLEATQSAHHHQWSCAHTFAQRTHIAMKFTFSRVPITILPRVSHKINRNNPDSRMSERKFVMANSASIVAAPATRMSNTRVENEYYSLLSSSFFLRSPLRSYERFTIKQQTDVGHIWLALF